MPLDRGTTSDAHARRSGALPAAVRHVGGLVLASLLAGAVQAGAAPVDEYQVKAAVVLTLTRFVQWPSAPGPAVRVCVMGHDPFGRSLDDLARKPQPGAPPILLARLPVTGPAAGCHVVFVGRVESAAVPELLAQLRGHPVLTVSDADHFTEQGGMVGLRTEGARVRFDVNLDASQAAGVRISSQVLGLATSVRGSAR